MKLVNNMDMNILTLKFRGRIEQEFREDYFKSSIGLLRLSFLLGMFYYSLFGFLDVNVMPEMVPKLFRIRFFLVIPCILIVFLLSFTRSFYRWWQLAAGIAAIISGLGIVIMTTLPHELARHNYYVGILLVLIYCYLLIRLRFIGATISGWIIFAFYFGLNYFISGENSSVLIINYFFLLSAIILGMFGGYVLEYFTRKEFYHRQLLKKEQQKVKNANEYLEEKVKEKTFELQKDVEKRKQAEQKLIQLKDNLQKEVSEKTKELKERVAELEHFREVTITRELRMEELRLEIEEFKQRIDND
jgi:hypothetical protein